MLILGAIGAALGSLWLVSVRYPMLAVVVVLLAYSQYLGFVPYAALEPWGIPDHATVTMLVVTLAAFTRIALLGDLWHRDFTRVGLLYGVLFAVGVSLPVWGGDSSIVAALRDGKGFLACGLAVLLTTVARPREICLRIIEVTAIVMSTIVLIHRVFGVFPPGYGELIPGVRGEGIHVYGPMFMAMWGVSLAIRGSGLRSARVWLTPLVVTGLLLQAHGSMTIVGLATIGVALAPAEFRNLARGLRRRPLSIALVLIPVLFVAGTEGDRVTTTVADVPEIRSRLAYDAFRYAAISNRPVLGYGFVDEESSLGAVWMGDATSRFDQRLGTVDSGYVDLLVRFGAVGAIAVTLFWASLGWRLTSRHSWAAMTFGAFLLLLLGANLTWSVFTYPLGLVPLILGVGASSGAVEEAA